MSRSVSSRAGEAQKTTCRRLWPLIKDLGYLMFLKEGVTSQCVSEKRKKQVAREASKKAATIV